MAIISAGVQVQSEHLRKAVEQLYAMVRPKGQSYELEFNMGWTAGGDHLLLKSSHVEGTSGHWIGAQVTVPLIGNAANDAQVGFVAKLKGSRQKKGYIDEMEQQPVHISVAQVADGPTAKLTFAQPAASNQDLVVEKAQVTGSPLLHVEAGDMITTTVGDLLDCLQSVIPYTGFDNNREYCHLVQVTAAGPIVQLTAVNGYMLGMAHMPHIDLQGEGFPRVVSAHALGGVAKILADYCRANSAERRAEVVTLTFDRTALGVSFAGELLLIELRKTHFPDVSSIMPVDRTWTSITLSPAQLSLVLDQAKSSVTIEGQKWVGLYLGEQPAIMAPQQDGQSWHGLTPTMVHHGREKCPQPHAIVSLTYLKTIAKTFQRFAEVKVIIRGPKNVLVLEAVEDDTNSFWAYLMPMGIDRANTEHTSALSAGPKGLPPEAPPAVPSPTVNVQPAATPPPAASEQPAASQPTVQPPAKVKTCTMFARWIIKLARQHGLDLETCELGEGLVLKNEPWMDLFIQKYAHNLVRVAHEGWQNGDVMYDPCVTFFTGYEANKWAPISSTQNYLPVENQFREVAHLTNDGTQIATLSVKQQHDLASFVNGAWFSALKKQGFMDNATPKENRVEFPPEPSEPPASAPETEPAPTVPPVDGQAQGFTAFTPDKSWGDRDDTSRYGQFLWPLYDLVTKAAPFMRTPEALSEAWADPNAPIEILGDLVGKFCAWESRPIFHAFFNALQDSNYHMQGSLIYAALQNQAVWDFIEGLGEFFWYDGDVDRDQLRQALDGLLANPAGQPVTAPPAEIDDEFLDPALVDELLGQVAGGNGQAVTVTTAPAAAPAIAPASAITEAILWPSQVGQVCPFAKKGTGKAIKAILRTAGFQHGQWTAGTDGIGYTPFTNGVTTIHVRSGRGKRAIVLVDGPPFNPGVSG
jgi:hypothetical protein